MTILKDTTGLHVHKYEICINMKFQVLQIMEAKQGPVQIIMHFVHDFVVSKIVEYLDKYA